MDSKNILIITGSPRLGGNSDIMADSFIKGAESKGHKVNKFNTVKNPIKGCIDCKTCWSKGTACSFKDGFTDLEPLLEEADVIVFSSPLYWFSMSAHIKAAIDKFYAYVSPNRKRSLKVKECALLMCGNDKGMDIFDGVLESYKHMLYYLGWNNIGSVLVPEVDNKGDIKNTNALNLSEELGSKV